MRLLMTSDLHLTDRPRDSYRFGLFTWLAEQQKKFNTDAVIILGDLTDLKDHHSSKLVNNIVNCLLKIKPPIYILKGNHDYINTSAPFFDFLNHIEGLHFITKTTEIFQGHWMIPHCGQQELDEICSKIPPKPKALYLHATFEGSVAESGTRLKGLAASPIELLRPALCWAGDVHKPQHCGPVTYLGAPYHVRFGDQYDPRVMLLDKGVERNLYFDCIRKWSLTVTDAGSLEQNKNLFRGDQVKLIVKLTREEAVEWPAHKRHCIEVCKKLGLEIHGLDLEMATGKRTRARLQQATIFDPKEVVQNFCKAEKLGTDIKNAGLELLED